MLKLNFGAGEQKMEDYKSVDISSKCNPDYVYDITRFPYPDEWIGADQVRCDNVLEHLDGDTMIKVINEIRRILKVGGQLWIRVPLLKMDEQHIDGAFTDPTHKNYFTIGSFDYWDKDHSRHKAFGKDYGIEPWKRIRNEDYPPKFLIVE